MDFLTSKAAVDFLAQAAPRPWVCRMLKWMIIDQEIDAYFSKTTFQASASALEFLFPFREEAGDWCGPSMDKIIDREFDNDLANKLKGKDGLEKIFDEPLEWNEPDAPEMLDFGFFLFGSTVDFDAGTLIADWLPIEPDIVEVFFPSGEWQYSNFDRPDYTAKLEGMLFAKTRIEMLLPNFSLENIATQTQQPPNPRPYAGRPRKWDWEAALAHIVAQAHMPDGLPTGHGAQARIETMIAEWFESEVGGSPAVSQIRKRASTVMRMLEKTAWKKV